MKETEQKPHDKYFKASFSNLDVAKEFIINFFPAELLEKLNLESLNLEDASFLDPNFKSYFSDLIYSIELKTGKNIRIVLLWEHKSYIPKYPHLQLLTYLLKHYEADIANDRPLTFVLPIVFYHGKTQWKYRKFKDYFKNLDSVFEKFIPNFDYILADLSQYSDEKILALNAHLMIPSLILMKHSREEAYVLNNLKKIFYKFAKVFKQDSEGLKKLLWSAYTYIYHTTNLEPKTIKEKVNQISEQIGEQIMTTATRLHQQGHQQGLQQGLQQGHLEERKKNHYLVIKNGYQMGLTIESLAKLTDLSIKEVKEILNEIQKELA